MIPLSFLRGWLLLPALLGFIISCEGGSPKLPLAGFKVEFGPHNIPTKMIAAKTVSGDVTIRNGSTRTWPSKPNEKGRHAVNLSYHWLGPKRQMIVFDGLRTPLPRDLGPGESATLRATIRRLRRPASIMLHMTMVQEAVA